MPATAPSRRRRLHTAFATAAAISLATVLGAPSSAASLSTPSSVRPRQTESHDPLHLHYSGWHPAARAEVEADMDQFMTVSDLITMTEVGSANKALDEEGWQKVWFAKRSEEPKRPGRTENGLTFKTDTYTLIYAEPHLLSKKNYYSSDGVAKFVWATTAVLEEIATGRRLVVSVSHLPPRVEGKDGFFRDTPNREEVYRAALPNWRQHIDDLASRYDASMKIATGDWNLDLKTRWVRRYLNEEWRQSDMEIVWKGNYPDEGTHEEGRIIDFTIANRVKAKPAILGDVESSDHNPFIETLRPKG